MPKDTCQVLLQTSQVLDILHPRGIEEEAKIKGVRLLKKSLLRQALGWMATLLSGGIFYLLTRWFSSLHVLTTYVQASPEEHTTLWAEVEDQQGQRLIVKTQRKQLLVDASQADRVCFEYRLYGYWVEEETGRVKGVDSHVATLDRDHLLTTYSSGLSHHQISPTRLTWGSNHTILPDKPWGRVLIEEALSPFSVFQVFSCVLWFFEEYILYAVIILVTSVVSSVVTVVSSVQQQARLRRMNDGVHQVEVFREGSTQYIPSDQLVVGDLVRVQAQCKVPCDLVLLRGECVVNESLLTGESCPVVKEGVAQTCCGPPYKAQSLFAGTQVLQVRAQGDHPVQGVVSQVGFSTLKGSLLRTLLFPADISFQFYRDCLRFLGCLFVLGIIGFGVSLYLMLREGVAPSDIVIRTLDLITICVPPALPTCMTVGTIFALSALKAQRIYCTSPSRLNIAARINLMCFDKTGTLTEEGLETHGVVQAEDIDGMVGAQDIPKMDGALLEAMATCHSVALVGGVLVGDPLEVEMVKATACRLEESCLDNDQLMLSVVRLGTQSLGVLRRFPFEAALQRMSTVVRCLGESHFRLVVKGSPEAVIGLSDPGSLPQGLKECLCRLTRQGFRVLALAHRPFHNTYLAMQQATRQSMEDHLTFLGLLVMANHLKPATPGVITQLHHAGVSTLMVTGDDLLTALSVAQESNMLSSSAPLFFCMSSPMLWHPYSPSPEPPLTTSQLPPDALLAMTGPVFRGHHLTKWVLSRTKVFGRMSPEDKQSLVRQLQEESDENVVGMCGDGANDCAALKQAQVGVSLSEAEASVAAPFTSQQQDIACMLHLLREGRCSLTTAFQCFKFMALYSLIQFAGVTLLYSVRSSYGTYQYVYVDLVLVFPLATFLSYTRSNPRLVAQLPPATLMSFPVLLSVFSLIALQLLFQLGAYLLLRLHYPLFVPCYEYVPQPAQYSDYFYCQENTTLFLFSNLQYLAVALAFATGSPFKRPLYTNLPLLILLLAQTVLNLIILFHPGDFLFRLFNLVPMLPSFKLHLFFLLLLNSFLTLSFELILLPLLTRLHAKRRFKSTQ